ncbi:VOC family protein [Arthrobacter tecti]
MKITRQTTVFDAADMDAESAFWAGLLDGTVEADDDWHSIWVDGEKRYAVQLAPDHVAPEWPAGTPQQLHVDLHVDNFQAAHEKAMSLGARLLQPAENLAAPEGFQVYADPAGHPFCLCWE